MSTGLFPSGLAPTGALWDEPTSSTVTGTLAATEAQDTASLSGSYSAPSVTGSLAANESQDTAAFSGALTFPGALAATEAADTASFAGSSALPGVSGSLAATETQDVADLSGTVTSATITGSLSATDVQDSAAFIGIAPSSEPDRITGGAGDYRFLNPERHRPKQVKKAIARAARRVIARGVDVPQSAVQQALSDVLQRHPQPADMALLLRQIEFQRSAMIRQAAISQSLQATINKSMTAITTQTVEDDDDHAIVMMLFEMV